MPSLEQSQWEFVQDISDFVRWLCDTKGYLFGSAERDPELAAGQCIDELADLLALEYANTFEWTAEGVEQP